jgi:hypothetical protein
MCFLVFHDSQFIVLELADYWILSTGKEELRLHDPIAYSPTLRVMDLCSIIKP